MNKLICTLLLSTIALATCESTDSDEYADDEMSLESNAIQAYHDENQAATFDRPEKGFPDAEYTDEDYAELFDRPEKGFPDAEDSNEPLPLGIRIDCEMFGDCP